MRVATLGLCDPTEDGPILGKRIRYSSPATSQRITQPLNSNETPGKEFGGDIRKFRVVKRYP